MGVALSEARLADIKQGEAHMYTKLCCCAARAYPKTLTQLGEEVSKACLACIQQGQADMYTKLCCCAARAYSKPLIMLWYSTVN